MNKMDAVQLLKEGKLKEGFDGLSSVEKFNFFGEHGKRLKLRDKNSRDPVLIVNIDQRGWGEQIMYSSIIHDFMNKHGLKSENVFWLGSPNIHSLIRDEFKIEVIDGILGITRPFYWVTVTEMASQCRKNVKTFLNAKHPYIKVDSNKSVRTKKLIGVSWASYTSKGDTANKDKSIPVNSFLELAKVEGVQFVSAQYTKTGMDCSEYNDDIKNLANIFGEDFSEPELVLRTSENQKAFAEFLAGLDGLISCSNSTVHLAGAMGIPTFLIFPDRGAKQWHWHLRNSEGYSLWYPKTKVHIVPEWYSHAYLEIAMKDAAQWLKKCGFAA